MTAMDGNQGAAPTCHTPELLIVPGPVTLSIIPSFLLPFFAAVPQPPPFYACATLRRPTSGRATIIEPRGCIVKPQTFRDDCHGF
ncbi:MAG: hypothetical protein ACR2M3_00915 [Thermomicrobiales bacterium]